jgi:L-lactate dehydrogenase complex protein LldG
MGVSKSKEKILKKVRNALMKRRATVPEPNISIEVFNKSLEKDLSIVFAESFIGTKGEFFFCEDKNEFERSINLLVKSRNLENIYAWEKDLEPLLVKSNVAFKKDDEGFLNAHVGITTCDFLIARTGSLIVTSKTASGRRLGIYPPIHIVVAYTSQIVEDIKDGLAGIKIKYKESGIPSMIGLVTGPSRTSDIEKTLVMGAHGPKELILFLIDDTSS